MSASDPLRCSFNDWRKHTLVLLFYSSWLGCFFPFSYFTSNSGISRKKRSLTLLAYVLHHHRRGLKFQKKELAIPFGYMLIVEQIDHKLR